MEKPEPKNLTELAGEELPENAPETTLDMQQFNKHLSEQKEEEPQAQITWREVKALKRSKYFDVKDRYTKGFVIQNKKTGAIAEIQAASAVQACNFIGWKPKQTKLLEEIDVDKRKAEVVKNLEKYEESGPEMASGSSS